MRKGMSCSDAGRLGAEKSRAIIAKKHDDFVAAYYNNPRHCRMCGDVIDFDHRENVFCSSACAATYNNINGKIGRRIKIHREGKYIGHHFYFKHICKVCEKEFFSRDKDAKFCSHRCDVEHRTRIAYEEVDRTGEFPTPNNGSGPKEASRKFVKRYLESRVGKKCAICGIDKWNGKPITLVVDHIDGNALNSKVDNFRLICPNCDSQLPTYKGRNKGHGRKWRRQQAMADAR